jgi:hypothetical protein
MKADTIAVIDRLPIRHVRGQAVVLDSDLAAVYGVTTSNLNKAIARNRDRFPPDFCFRLDPQELANLKFQFGTSSSHGGRRKIPRVFTEHGAIMAATILNSPRAVAMSVYVVRGVRPSAHGTTRERHLGETPGAHRENLDRPRWSAPRHL